VQASFRSPLLGCQPAPLPHLGLNTPEEARLPAGERDGADLIWIILLRREERYNQVKEDAWANKQSQLGGPSGA